MNLAHYDTTITAVEESGSVVFLPRSAFMRAAEVRAQYVDQMNLNREASARIWDSLEKRQPETTPLMEAIMETTDRGDHRIRSKPWTWRDCARLRGARLVKVRIVRDTGPAS